MSTGRTPSPRDVDCRPDAGGCAATAGEPCLSHGGTRVRTQFHQTRRAAWNQKRINANPAVRLILDAAKQRRGMHGSHAAELLDEHSYTAEAERVRHEVSAAHGHLSAKQAAALLLDHAEGGEG